MFARIFSAVRIARTIIHENDLEVTPGKRGLDLLLEGGDIFFLVIDRHDDGDIRRSRLVSRACRR